jgi:hypothetical protein
LRHGLIAAAALTLTACTGLMRHPQPLPLLDYQPESFDASAFSRHYAARPARTCEAARRALLSQGYVLAATAADQVTARKYFQPDVEHHVQLEFKIVCAPEAGDSSASMAFASGLKDQYVIRKAKESASVGVGGIGSLSLPIEGGMDALVKVSSETVTNRALYERLFDLVSEHLSQAVEPPASEPAAPPTPAALPQPTIILLHSAALPPPMAAAAASAPQPAASMPEPAASAAE